MYRRLLVGIDGSAGARAALKRAIQLAREHDAVLYGVAVEEPLPPYARTVGQTEDAREEAAIYFAQIVGQARKAAASMDVPITCEVQLGHPAKVLIERSRQLDCDLIVLGHARRALGNWHGSIADRVINRAHCDVLIVR